MPPLISFHTEQGGQPVPVEQEAALIDWVKLVVQARHGIPEAISYIFCGDAYLHQMNVEYLNHDTLTDIITFPYDSFPTVSGDLFISTERVSNNAVTHGTRYTDELHRVMIHGVLHLCGQGDKSEEEQAEMSRQEEWALSLRPSELL